MKHESAREKAIATAFALELWAEAGRCSTLPVQGWSMWPVLQPGNEISIRHSLQPPLLGEIAVARVDSRSIAHRVVARRERANGTQVLLKGDSNFLPDTDWTDQEQIVGVVEGVVRNGAGVSRLGLSGKTGRLLGRLSRLQGLLFLPVSRFVAASSAALAIVLRGGGR